MTERRLDADPRRRDGAADGESVAADYAGVSVAAALGNQRFGRIVSRSPRPLLLREPAAPATVAAPPAAAPAVPGKSKVVPGPPTVQGVEHKGGPKGEAEVGADAQEVTVTFVLKDVKALETGAVEFLSEPEIAFAPSSAPKAAVEAAISALNIHIKRHGKDLVELSAGPSVGLEHGKPEVGAKAQAKFHITSTFSIVASSSIKGPSHEEPEQGQRALKHDLLWSPMSIGVQYELGHSEHGPERPKGLPDYSKDMPDEAAIRWVTGQLDAKELTPRGRNPGDTDVSTRVTELRDAMQSAGGGEAQWQMHLGEVAEGDLPPTMSRTLARAAQLLVSVKPELAKVQRVRVTVMAYPRGQRTEKAIRWMLLPVERGTAKLPAGGP